MPTVLRALHDSAIGVAIREGESFFPWLEVIHVVAITTVVGTISIVDLRLLGLAGKDYPIRNLTRTLIPATWGAFAIAFASGVLMFTSRPESYFANTAFGMKMLMLLAAALNMAVFHLLTSRALVTRSPDAPPPASVKAAGAISMLIWVVIVALGRWIGFSLPST